MITLNDFYGFDQTPFTKSIAAENLYRSRGHQEVQGRLNFALNEHLPALITGDVGTGKSTGDCVDPPCAPSSTRSTAMPIVSSISPILL